MTVQTATRPSFMSPLIAVVLLCGILIGFVVGQAVPKLTDLGSRPASTSVTGQLSPADDYGIRHPAQVVPGASIRLTDADDWALRHAARAVLGPADDYGTRH
jgi:hypothetical protein